MIFMGSIPDDVLKLIFDHVSEEYISNADRAKPFAQLCKVSRHFYKVAIGYLYSAPDMRRDRHIARKVIATLAKNPQLAILLRELILDYDDIQMEHSLFIQLLVMVLREAKNLTKLELYNYCYSSEKNNALDTIFDMPFEHLSHLKLSGQLDQFPEGTCLPLTESLTLINLPKYKTNGSAPLDLSLLEDVVLGTDPVACGLQDVLIGIETRQGQLPATRVLSTIIGSSSVTKATTTATKMNIKKKCMQHLEYTDHHFPDASLGRCTPHLVRLQLSSLDLAQVPLVTDNSLVPLIMGLSPSLRSLRLYRVGFSPAFFETVASWLPNLTLLSCEPIAYAQTTLSLSSPLSMEPIPLDAPDIPPNSYAHHNELRIAKYLKSIMQYLLPLTPALKEFHIDFRCLSTHSPIISTDAFDQIKPPTAENLEALEIVGIRLYSSSVEKFAHAPLKHTRLQIVQDNQPMVF